MIIGNVILHVSSSGSQVRNLQYDFGSDSYAGTDLSIMAAHLLERYKLMDWTYRRTRIPSSGVCVLTAYCWA